MYAETVFKRIQLGFESTPGTPVAAPKLLYGEASMPSTGRQIDIPKSGLPYLAGHSALAYTVKVEENGISTNGQLGIENTLRLLALANGEQPTPTDNGDGTFDFIFEPDYDGTNDSILTATLEVGTNAVAYRLPFAFLTGLTFKGSAPNGEATFDADFIAQTRTPGSWTTHENPYLHIVNGKLSKLYYDGTEIANALVDWDFSWATGLHAKRTGSDNLTYESIGRGPIEILMSVSVERTDAVAAMEADYLSTDYKPSIKPLILQVSTPDGFYVKIELPHAVLIDFQPFPGDNDGNATDTIKWQAAIGSNGFCKVTVHSPVDTI